MRVLRLLLFLGLIWAFMFPFLPAASAGARLTANLDQLRALYVQRLVKYVNWPDGVGPKPGEPFIVAATDPASLRPYFGSPDGSVRFKLVQWPASDFHVLVLTGAPAREISAILKRVADLPILTISQNPIHLRQGVVVNFYMNNGNLKFEINPAAAKRGGLSISSRLLQLARIYKGGADD